VKGVPRKILTEMIDSEILHCERRNGFNRRERKELLAWKTANFVHLYPRSLRSFRSLRLNFRKAYPSFQGVR
jgi:hypothetical protein